MQFIFSKYLVLLSFVSVNLITLYINLETYWKFSPHFELRMENIKESCSVIQNQNVSEAEKLQGKYFLVLLFYFIELS